MMGQLLYPDQKHLLIEADCGGSNGNRSRVWKMGLQLLVDEFGLIITVTHYPTGASKWNPIEHRMFNLINANWAGEPLDSYETILKYIRTTKTCKGLRVRSHLVRKKYKKGIKITNNQMKEICIMKHNSMPKWNYTICPTEMLD